MEDQIAAYSFWCAVGIMVAFYITSIVCPLPFTFVLGYTITCAGLFVISYI